MTDIIDISGYWKLFLAPDSDKLLDEISPVWDDTIELPGSTSLAKKGIPSDVRETGFLTEPYKFSGTAWFRKKVSLPDITCRTVRLFLERTRISTVYLDGRLIGSQDSLIAPHIYELPEETAAGEHELIIAVRNIGYKTGGGHLTSADTQTNWCGITGRMELQIYSDAVISGVKVYADPDSRTVTVSGKVTGEKCKNISCIIEGKDAGGNAVSDKGTYDISDGTFSFEHKVSFEPNLWSDETPETYKLTLEVGSDSISMTIGFRSFKADGDKFSLNGRHVFLRGKHDGMIFPLTGFAPTDVESWERVMGIVKSYGFNHYRFHTCCPPDAAFEAADRLGIIMEPQVPFWGTLRAPDEPEYNKEEQDFLISEGFKMLECFGHHPSFCMMSLGNELWGSQQELNRILRLYKNYDPHKLYTQGSNNFQWFPAVLEEDDFFVGVRLANDRLIRGSYAMCDAPLGHVQTDKPSTLHDYDDIIVPKKRDESTSHNTGTVQIQFGTGVKTVEATDADSSFISNVPIVTHEIGQYETYPDFDEIKKYTGALKARNFEIFKERLEAAGLGKLAKDYFLCSGKLAAACYREELEAVFRSRKLAGFQLLDLQDFSGQGTALVGMLDAFMDSKGLIKPEEWRQFCNDAVILARFDSYCLSAGDTFNADVQLAYFRSADISGSTAIWKLYSDEFLYEDSFTIDFDGSYADLGRIELKLPEVDCPTVFRLDISVQGTDIRNSYELTVYPVIESVDITDARIFSELDEEAEKLLEEGRTVLIVPALDKLTNSIEGFYCTDFWCYPMFRSISESMGKPLPVGTMGLLIDSDHPLFVDFPTEKWSTPKWWDIVMNSRSEILDGRSEDKKVIVRTIDNFERNHDLAMIYEYKKSKGKVVVCNVQLDKLTGSPEGRAFISSLIKYVSNKL